MQQIVISIDDDLYKSIKNNRYIYEEEAKEVALSIIGGIPLPKWHGRLVDMNNVHLELDEFMYNIDGVHEFLDDEVQAIIEADKEVK